MSEYYTFELSENVNRTSVSYRNRYGITLVGDLYTSKHMDAEKKYPALVIGAPYGGVKEQGPGVYANQLAQRGFVVLTFDASYNGESGGEPRHTSSPEIFSEDFSAGVDFLGSRRFVDRNKIGALGICGSGGFALSAAAMDVRIKAIATSSMYDISAFRDLFPPEMMATQMEQLAQQRWEDFENGKPAYIPTFPESPVDAVPEGLEANAEEFFSYYGLKRGHHPNARGGFTLTSNLPFMNYQLLNHIATISPRPILFVMGENAHSRFFSENAYEAAAEPKEMYIVPDAIHIDLYDQVDMIPFDKIEEFFKSNL
ncbi:alpha/beta superfamily hydrolase [Desulfosporosinus orientis DSM 765]|uniref:Alpha/beta superfamily hydrolase n=1 Tax=Desulfosporosinus orientis (strain ATCC 19365 / DSM 765 / NCIMB 8382 / VKM B-1628 / Singapore I) TaxID=768706 RepID=G7W6L9_DESOD|nr:alpha/beta hydrolase [Desulfosporosinus orientis]AET68657.1 alpha/beta superfamily hydrolase [Desulfosporosinus orientis DSM 765]